MAPETHILLLGHPTEADAMIRRALRRCWPGCEIHCAPDPAAAIGILSRSGGRPGPVVLDLAIVKIQEPERMTARRISGLRGHRSLRHTIFAAFLEGGRTDRFPCMRGAGLTAVLTESTFALQIHDLADAVVGSWIAPRDMDCSERYFCPQCTLCRVAAQAGTAIPPVQPWPYLVYASDADKPPG